MIETVLHERRQRPVRPRDQADVIEDRRMSVTQVTVQAVEENENTKVTLDVPAMRQMMRHRVALDVLPKEEISSDGWREGKTSLLNLSSDRVENRCFFFQGEKIRDLFGIEEIGQMKNQF